MKKVLLIALLLIAPCFVHAQGMPIDSLFDRLSQTFSKEQLASLHETLPIRYDDQRVWGLAIGDFSNDSLPDLAISLFDVNFNSRNVKVHLLRSEGSHFTDVFQKQYSYVETPIEVGLSVEGAVVSILQKFDESHWRQEGYTVYAGDVISIDELETRKEDIPALTGKNKAMAHDLYRNFETLTTKESFYSTKDNLTMQKSLFYTFPAYNRLRYVYPGYGRDMNDSSSAFIVKGNIFRRDAKDLSIRRALSAFDEEYMYFSISVRDDQVWGGNEKQEHNDRVTLWFDAFKGDNRYLTKPKKGTIPQFRTETDSTIYSVTFAMPAVLSQTPNLTVSSATNYTEQQREAITEIRATVIRDTADGVVSGYTLKARIPFTYLGYESNPITAYENRLAESQFGDGTTKKKTIDEVTPDHNDFPIIGFTTVVTDVDDPTHPEEITEQATSDFRSDNPSTFGELMLIPTGTFYGEVYPTYTRVLTDELIKAGY